MGSSLRFWFIKRNEEPFENSLDTIREALNDAGSKEFVLKGLEVTAEAGRNNIEQEITLGSAGKLRGIDLGLNYQSVAPPAAPRPTIAQIIQFRDFIDPVRPLEKLFPTESLMEFTARLSHKVGEILLLNADRDDADGYISFKEGNISSFGFRFEEDFIIRFYRSEFELDIYNVGEEAETERTVNLERILEAVEKSGMSPCTTNKHEGEMAHHFWYVAKEGFNIFYGTKLKSLGTWESNFATLHNVGDPGVGHYDIYPDGVTYSYPEEQRQPDEKKPWWKFW